MFSVHMVIRSSLCYKYDTVFSWLLKHIQNMDLLFYRTFSQIGLCQDVKDTCSFDG